jgi:hypothetical protein
MNFSSLGFLTPVGPQEAEWSDLTFFFSGEPFSDSESRLLLQSNLEAFLGKFKTIYPSQFLLWVDGSFISLKPNPKDLDLVLELDWFPSLSFNIAKDQQEWRYLMAFSKDQKSQAFVELKIDAYMIINYPEGHNRRKIYALEKAYWENFFSNDDRVKAKKGFLKIQFQRP